MGSVVAARDRRRLYNLITLVCQNGLCAEKLGSHSGKQGARGGGSQRTTQELPARQGARPDLRVGDVAEHPFLLRRSHRLLPPVGSGRERTATKASGGQ